MKTKSIVILIIVLVVIGAVALYLFDQAEEQPVATPVAVTESQTEARPPAAEVVEAPEPGIPRNDASEPPVLEELPVPALADSDGYARENLSEVVGEATAIQYFATDGLVARSVATIDAMSSRKVPGNIQVVTGPKGEYSALPDPAPARQILDEAGDPIPQYQSDPVNAERYRPYVEMLEAVDAAEFATTYERNASLFGHAWRQLGYTDKVFDQRLVEVIDELLATPEVSEPYQLIKPEAYYVFADENLERLTAGQKILLRMGADNAQRVKDKLREIRQALGVTSEE